MRGSLHAFVLLGLVSAAALGAAPPAAESPVRLPDGPPVPQPPAPRPDQAATLPRDALYVVDSDVPVILLASPKGLVTISEEVGPIKIRGRFVGGTGKVETRTFRGKAVFTVEAAGTGRVELLVVPLGLKAESEVVRRTLDVDAGQGPIPPPKPDPPAPDDKPLIPGPGLKVLIAYDSAKAHPASTNTILYGQATRQWLEDNCAAGPDGRTRQYRVSPHTTAFADPLWADAMKRPRASLPWVVVSNSRTGWEGPLPATADEFLALVKKYKE